MTYTKLVLLSILIILVLAVCSCLFFFRGMNELIYLIILICTGILVTGFLVLGTLVPYSRTMHFLRGGQEKRPIFSDIIHRIKAERDIIEKKIKQEADTKYTEQQSKFDAELRGKEQVWQAELKRQKKIINNIFIPIKKILFNRENDTTIMDRILSILEDLYKNIDNTTGEMEQQSDLLSLAFDTYGETSMSLEMVDQTIRQAQRLSEELADNTGKGIDAIIKTRESSADILGFSKEMVKIIAMIEDISDRTALLSIHASIESAHAGAMGRGFAVIAQEIKKLTSSSKAASHEIKTIIDDVIAKIKRQSQLIEVIVSQFSTINACIEKTGIINNDIYQFSKKGMIQSKEIQTAVTAMNNTARKIIDVSNKQLLQAYEAKNILGKIIEAVNNNYIKNQLVIDNLKTNGE